MSLRDRLTSGSFAVTAEISPPRGASMDPITATAALLRDWVDAVNVTDNQGSNVRLASWAGSLAVLQAGLEPVMQMTCRDRNRIALQSDLLGASALGIRNVLVMTGDHPKFGDHPEAKPVFDLDSVQLLWTLRHMRDQGAVLSGRALKPPPDCFLGAVENPFAPPAGFRAERLGKKIDAGAQFVQTQFVFDVAVFARWMEQVRELGLHQKCYILAGVGAVRSRNALDFMRDKVPGVNVPDEVYRRLRAVPADQTAAEGARLAAETIQQLRAIDGVAGVHLLVAGNEQAVPGILDEAGVVAGRAQFGIGHSMDVDLRPVKKLRESAAARSALGPIMEAVCASPADLARLRVVCDWIQYKQNFREPVVSRPVGDTGTEVAFDLRRCTDIDPENLTAHVKQALQEHPGLARWSRGCPAGTAASGGSTSCTGRRCRTGRWPPAGSTSSRCPAARATRGTSRPPGSSSWSCSGSGTNSTPAARCPRSCTCSSSAWATVTRPVPGWTSSSGSTAGTGGSTTTGSAT